MTVFLISSCWILKNRNVYCKLLIVQWSALRLRWWWWWWWLKRCFIQLLLKSNDITFIFLMLVFELYYDPKVPKEDQGLSYDSRNPDLGPFRGILLIYLILFLLCVYLILISFSFIIIMLNAGLNKVFPSFFRSFWCWIETVI